MSWIYQKWERICYRCRQFWSILFPEVDEQLWNEAVVCIPVRWQKAVAKLRPSEKAHILRLYKAIRADKTLKEEERRGLIALALVHDIGKIVTKPGLIVRVVMTLLPVPKNSHPIMGVRILRSLGASHCLLKRVRRHHEDPGTDQLLTKFQMFDDAN